MPKSLSSMEQDKQCPSAFLLYLLHLHQRTSTTNPQKVIMHSIYFPTILNADKLTTITQLEIVI